MHYRVDLKVEGGSLAEERDTCHIGCRYYIVYEKIRVETS